MFKANNYYETLAKHPDKLVGHTIAQMEVRDYLTRKEQAEREDAEAGDTRRRSKMTAREKSNYITANGNAKYLALPY